MKSLIIILLIVIFWHTACAQTDTLHAAADSVKKDGEIKLPDSFKKALDAAFTFDPVAAPLPKQNELTVEQLHEWVGKPSMPDTARNAGKFNETYKALKMWEKEFYVPLNQGNTKIVLNLGPMPGPSNCAKALDVNALGQYIRPKEIRLRKMRKKAHQTLQTLDQFLLQP